MIGEGGSGGALALGVADRVLMLENAIYSVITAGGLRRHPVEGRHERGEKERAAEALRSRPTDLLELGVIDEIIPEPLGGAHIDQAAAAKSLQGALTSALDDLRRVKPDKLVRRRREKFLRMGMVTE